ncbi:MAG: DUF3710 domain-containing protein [Actinobacteria bacterium]|nr:DUF3710 domain-containing protein [Actinomycetota bacterium]
MTEVDFSDGVERLDLGALRVTATEGIDVQVQVDENSGNIIQLTFAKADGAVQVQPYAAPRSGGLWDTVRSQIKASISTGGGLVEDVDGPFGVELRAQVKADGSPNLQPARFTGIEGPRWFLRAVFLGAATKPGPTSDALEAMVRGLIVVRGGEAMPVGAPIPLRLPSTETADGETGPATTLPSPFARGPEITETR